MKDESMDIVIYDTQHFETTYAYIRLFDHPTCRITLFISPEVEKPLKDNLGVSATKYTWVIRTGSNIKFAKKLYKTCLKVKPAYLIFTTISDYHLVYGLICMGLTKTKTILVIHDANSFFKPVLSLSARSLVKYLGKKALSFFINSYATLLSSTKDYIATTFKPNKPIHLLPGGIYENYNPPQPSSYSGLQILIPGSIDKKRRAYEEVWELVNLLKSKEGIYRIILLGKPVDEYGLLLLKQLREVTISNIELVVFDQFVEQSVYNNFLKDCDVIWIPLRKEFINDSMYTESYGITKASGSFFDAVRYAKPMLLPAHITIVPELQQQILTYSSIENLTTILEELSLKDSYYNRVLEQAKNNALNFTVDAVRSRISLIQEG